MLTSQTADSLGRLFRFALLGAVMVSFTTATEAADWPSQRHDNYRSGQTGESIDTPNLSLAWKWQSPHPVQPAWAGPAMGDAYNDIPRLNSMRNYDAAFHVSVVGDSVYFGSSVDDTVRCLNTKDGNERWRFTTDGPVRIAPTVDDGKVYFGSDDGTAYCLTADQGDSVWTFNPNPNHSKIINNGRLISFWPVRTGVMVDKGTAYFCGSMLPWRRSYLCAVDAKTGKAEGEGRFVKEYTASNSFEGAMLASKKKLIIPQGRLAPMLLDRKTGAQKGKVDNHGSGCFVLLTPDNQLYHGPGNRDGNFTASNAATGARLATFPMGQSMIVRGDSAFLLSTPTKNSINPKKRTKLNIALGPDKGKTPLIDTDVDRKKLGIPTITSFSRSGKRIQWRVQGHSFLSIVLAGDKIFAGTVDGVVALSAEDGSLLWESPVHGRAFGLAVADGALFVSTDEGGVYCFRTDAETKEKIATRQTPSDTSQLAGKAEPMDFAWGPFIQFDSPTSATIRWATPEKMITTFSYDTGGAQSDHILSDATKEQKFRISGLGHRRQYNFTIGSIGDNRKESIFRFDTFFNYAPVNITASSIEPRPEAADAKKILAQSKVDRGLAVVMGVADGSLAMELARQSKLQVLCVESDPAKVKAARDKIQAAGLYGIRVAVLQVDSLDGLPLPNHFANLVVSLASNSDHTREAFRILRPLGGTALLGQPSDELLTITYPRDKDLPIEKSAWVKFTKGPLEGSGEWSHQYGQPNNSAFGGETLSYISAAAEMQAQWVGRPGPRFQPDRSGRKVGPLSTNGRLFTQGLNRIVALDSYNGCILWSAEMNDLGRFNVPRDSANWCADDDHVYVTINDRLWRLNANDGNLSFQYPVLPGKNKDWKYNWSYIASHGDQLLGSATKRNSAFREFRGHAAWYDAPKGPQAAKVCSDNLFAVDKQSGNKNWEYTGDGVIINPTITLAGDRVYFVECRNAKVKAADTRQVDMPELWLDQHLVAIDAKTGSRVWERPLDTEDGLSVFYLAHNRGKLVIVASGNKQYHVSAYNDQDGKLAWEDRFGWPKGAHDHGKAMSRPAFLNGVLFVRPRAYDLASGKALSKVMPGGGCGTYACAGNQVIFRGANVTMWDYRYEMTTSWSRLRPGCWLSTIPAGGMLLSPEASGGCSCGVWLETSIGFMPKKADVPAPKKKLSKK